jgi:predicted RND superfamily exporter protein
MPSRFYKRFSPAILWLVALSFPYLLYEGQSVRCNNDIETWLPQQTPVRAAYEEFKRQFGVEELVLIGVEREAAPDELVESVCSRLERLPGVRCCWSAGRLAGVMADLQVPAEEAQQRLKGLALSNDGRMSAIIVLLSQEGLHNRVAAVEDIRQELDYCGLNSDRAYFTGGPVVIAEMDRLGGQKENSKFFVVTLLICLGLLSYWVNDWKLALLVLALTLWSINLTLATFKFLGGEMNFILSALAVMVMVFTLEASIHVIHYHKSSLGRADPLGEALKLCVKPCLISLMTTAVGLFSVSVTDILPITQFGFASTLGAVIAMLVGLVVTPAILSVLPQPEIQAVSQGSVRFSRLAQWLLPRGKMVTAAFTITGLVAVVGLLKIETRIEPLDFLPRNSKVVADVERVTRDLTYIDSIEAIVDFGDQQLSLAEKLKKVRSLEQTMREHPSVRHTMSAAQFFPVDLPQDTWAMLDLLKRAEARRGANDFVADAEQLWRISARVRRTPQKSLADVHRDLEHLLAGQPVRLTGIAPLVEQAQSEMFEGFWQSFTVAFVVIGVVMVCYLRCPVITLMAMIPNVLPMGMVFGLIGWYGMPVDIGMMMTGSIALGISIDGTFHFLVRYLEQLRAGRTNQNAVRVALMTTGGPIFESILVSSIGMLALSLSSFAPTARFGVLMATLLMATLAGDLLLLPALLSMRRIRVSLQDQEHHQRASLHVAASQQPVRLAADRVA